MRACGRSLPARPLARLRVRARAHARMRILPAVFLSVRGAPGGVHLYYYYFITIILLLHCYANIKQILSAPGAAPSAQPPPAAPARARIPRRAPPSPAWVALLGVLLLGFRCWSFVVGFFGGGLCFFGRSMRVRRLFGLRVRRRAWWVWRVSCPRGRSLVGKGDPAFVGGEE